MRGRVVLLIWEVGIILVTATGLTATVPSVPQQSLLPLPPIGHPINLSITPQELSGNASMRPGTYLLDEPLRLQVTSSNSGWYVQIHAASLKGPDDEIGPEDIHIETKQGAVALDQPQVVVQDGDLGETTVEVLIELQTTQRHKPGTYVGELLVIAGYVGGPPPEVIKVPFEVEVACSVSGSIQGNKMYFHYGLPGKSLSASAQGEVSADTDVYLSLSVTEGRVDCLPMLRSFSGEKRPNKSHVIPLAWALRENATDWRKPDNVSFDGGQISWELAANSEKVFYELQCSPQPDAAQSPGDYAFLLSAEVMTGEPLALGTTNFARFTRGGLF